MCIKSIIKFIDFKDKKQRARWRRGVEEGG
jgi:hypothetical protein